MQCKYKSKKLQLKIYNIETYQHLMRCFRQQSGSSIYQKHTAQQLATIFTQ